MPFLVGVTRVIFNWSLPGGYMKAGEHPTEAIEREIKEESGFIVSVDESLKMRTDRTGSRLDICYIGVFIGGEFTPSKEVSEYGFFSQDAMPLLRSNQVFLIASALLQKRLHTTSGVTKTARTV